MSTQQFVNAYKRQRFPASAPAERIRKAAKPSEMTACYDSNGALIGVADSADIGKIKPHSLLFDENHNPVSCQDMNGKTVKFSDAPAVAVQKAMKAMLRQEVITRHLAAVQQQKGR